MANSGADDFEDIRIVPPPEAPPTSAAEDVAPSAAYDDGGDDDAAPSEPSASSSSASPSLFRSLLRSWQNEVHAPDVLPYAASLMASARALCEARQSAIDDAAAAESASVESAWESSLYQLELDRLVYLITDYHRVRLRKAERYAVFLQLSERRMALLSDAEAAFVRRYADAWGAALRAEFLSRLSASLPALKRLDAEDAMVLGWDNCAHLFVRARRDAGLVDMSAEGDEEPIDVRAGDVYIARYHARMQELLRQGHVDLI